MLKDILNFLSVLKENNHKEWFDENRDWYQKTKKNYELFAGRLIQEILKFDKNIGTPEVKDCVFRIFRDVRFSNDKTPYKTHMGVYVAKGGRKSILGGYYFHMEPENSVLAGGIWMPQAPVLKALRSEIYSYTDDFKGIINSKSFKNILKSLIPTWVCCEQRLKIFPKTSPISIY
ncbi:MAG: DUF2461 domain-containing protein [Bacteroidetes bacterium]|nr:DUF2461 domain-containing protein [Bacteroidota bacterium]